ncbi:MAG: serine hydrolase domain-containing protein, partial [Acidimicrobiales bacterium]
KVASALAMAQLWQDAAFDLDDGVADFLPELRGPATAVTVRHQLTHTAGLAPVATFAEVASAGVRPGWAPGLRAAYDPRGGFLVLGELAQRWSGAPFDRLVRERLFGPLGMGDSWLAIDGGRHAAYGERLAVIHATAPGRDRPAPRWERSSAATAGRCLPGSSGFGPVRELARLAELLLGRGRLGGAQLLTPQTVEAVTARHRVGLRDETFGARLDWGLGVLVDSKHYGVEAHPYGYGPHASARTVGHGGWQSSVVLADPDHGLAAAVFFNGMPGEPAHRRRTHELLGALYEDLGLAG